MSYSSVIIVMILKVEGWKRTHKPSCKTIWFVESFSTLWPAVGRASQMKTWSTDLPHCLSSVLQADSCY